MLFPIVHGTWGEDGTLQGLCEMLDLPYVGPGVTASALAMDKVLCKRQLAAAGVPVVEFEAVTRRELRAPTRAAFLARLRAAAAARSSSSRASAARASGCARSPTRAGLEDAAPLRPAFDDVVLVERGVDGRELECAVLGYGELKASAVGEIVPGNEFYDYADKYLQDTAGLIAPADIPERGRRAPARPRGRGLRGDRRRRHGAGRLPARRRTTGLSVNEINTLPGFTSISMYPRLWALSGVPLPALVDRLVEIALQRHRDRHRLDAGIKAFLADLEREE